MGNAMRKKKSLPEELVVEILLKLSVKSLLRCRCVCKSLNDSIKTPSFINLHLIKNQNHNNIILFRRLLNATTTLSFLDYESLDEITHDLEIPVARNGYLDVCGPCNGLICISHTLIKIVLCNPSLREFRKIPLPRFTCPEGYYVDSMFCLGLGFDSNTNDYKIVSFLSLSPHPDVIRIVSEKVQCLIYNVGINTWREIDHQQELKMSYILPISSGVLLNGALHWIVVGRDISITFILCFDLSTEVFGKMTLPNTDSEEDVDPKEKKRLSLIALNGSLALFAYDVDTSEQQFLDIWVMKQYGVAESWTKQFTVGPITDLYRPLLVRKNEILFLERELASDERQLLSRGLDNDENDAYKIDGYEDTFRVMVNQESLVSIK